MRHTVLQLIAIPLGVGMALGILYLYSACNSGPPPDSRIVEGVDGWHLAVPDDVIRSTRADFAVKADGTPDPCFNLEIESTEFVPIGCVDMGDWIRWRNQREFQPGEYYVRVTSSGERDILVETTIIVDHDEEVPDGPPHRIGLDLEAAKGFEDFDIFWLGEEFDGIPIRTYHISDDHSGLHPVSFQYGTCRIVGLNEGCRVPLTVRVGNCRPVFDGDDPPGNVRVRGALAERTGTAMTIWTGASTVRINAMSEEQVTAVANALIALTPGGPETPAEDLPPSTCMPAPPGPAAAPTRLESPA